MTRIYQRLSSHFIEGEKVMRPCTKTLFSLAILLLLTPLTSYGQAQTQPQQTPAESRSPFKVQIFDVKNRNAETLVVALDGLRSGAPNTAMVANRALKTITVRDFPENIAAIGDALKRLDVPEPVPPPMAIPVDIEFNLYLIAASQTAGEKTPFPPAVEPVVTQMRSTLKFSNYRFLTTFTNRVNDDGRITSSGVISSPFPVSGVTATIKSNYSYDVNNVRSFQDPSGKTGFNLRNFKFSLSVPIDSGNGGYSFRDVGISTQLNLREGEMAVVGTANVGSSDEAVIVVVTAKKVK
jgi:hypothetical protein